MEFLQIIYTYILFVHTREQNSGCFPEKLLHMTKTLESTRIFITALTLVSNIIIALLSIYLC